jgi:hypothetical protein
MVTKILHLAGLYLGEESDLAGPAPDNQDGFWENLKFVKLNDEMLSASRAAWDCPQPLPADWAEREDFQSAVAKAEILLAEFAGHEPWGWKDPRNSFTLPVWGSLLPQLSVVVCLRRPLDVIHSLQRRNNLSFELCTTLWTTYMEAILENTSLENRIITHYDAYFDGTAEPEIRRLLDFVKLPVTPEVIERCRSAVLEGLRHHRSATDGLETRVVPSAIAELYERLCAEAGYADGGGTVTLPSTTHPEPAVSSEINLLRLQIAGRDRLVRALQSRLADLGDRVAIEESRLGAQAELSRVLVEQRDETIRALRAEIEMKSRDEESNRKLSERVAEFSLAVQRSHSELQAKLWTEIQERDDQIRALQTAAHQSELRIRAIEDAASERERDLRKELAALSSTIAKRDESIHRTQALFNERERDARETIRTLEAQSAQAVHDRSRNTELLERCRSVELENESLQETVRDLEGQRHALEMHRNALARQHDETHRKLESIYASRLWRMGTIYWRTLRAVGILTDK